MNKNKLKKVGLFLLGGLIPAVIVFLLSVGLFGAVMNKYLEIGVTLVPTFLLLLSIIGIIGSYDYARYHFVNIILTKSSGWFQNSYK